MFSVTGLFKPVNHQMMKVLIGPVHRTVGDEKLILLISLDNLIIVVICKFIKIGINRVVGDGSSS